MIRKTLAVLLISGGLAGCGTPGFLAGQRVGDPAPVAAPVTETAPIEGQAGDVEFLLDEDVFRIERSPHILLIAMLLSLPLLMM